LAALAAGVRVELARVCEVKETKKGTFRYSYKETKKGTFRYSYNVG